MFTVSLPVIFVNAPASAVVRDYWTPMDIVGLSLFCIGLTVEAIADQIKFMFRNDPKNNGKWCDSGVFAGWNISCYSLHVNFFYLIAVPVVELKKQYSGLG